MSDELKYASETTAQAPKSRAEWTLLIVDDEREVHSVTMLALEDFRFAGRGLRFLHAYSGAEAKRLLIQHPETALVLLDVVMETDGAGLGVVEYVRNDLHNKFVRILLRTGQPGQAPELDVITRYDINGYTYKTELTRERLFTAVYTSLSTYRDLVALDANRRGLEKVIEASAQLFEISSLERFAQGVLEQLIALLFMENDAVMVRAAGLAAADRDHGERLLIVAATGAFKSSVGCDAEAVLPEPVLERIHAAQRKHETVYGEDYLVGFQPGQQDLIFYVAANEPLSLPDRRLIELFYRNVAIAYENLRRFQAARTNRP